MYQLPGILPAPPVFLNQTPGATGRAAGSTPPGCLLAFTLKRVLNQALFTANVYNSTPKTPHIGPGCVGRIFPRIDVTFASKCGRTRRGACVRTDVELLSPS